MDRDDDLLFTLVWVGAVQPVGEPLREGDNHIRLEMTPAQMRRLVTELKPYSITAIMLMIEFGYRPGQPVEVVGWSGRWLREMGMSMYDSREAIAELRDKGYVRSLKIDSEVKGRQRGVLAAGVAGEVEADGDPRRDGRPRSVSRFPASDEVTPVSTDPANDHEPVSRFPANGGFKVSGIPETGITSSQVSPVSTDPASREIEPSSSSSVSGEVLLFGSMGEVDYDSIRGYLAQGWLVDACGAERQRAITLLQAPISDYSEQAGSVLAWLGRPRAMNSSAELASVIVDIIAGRDTVDPTSVLRRNTVHHPRITDRVEIGHVLTIGLMTALAANPSSHSGWVGSIANGRRFHPNKSSKAILAALDVLAGGSSTGAARDADGNRPVTGEDERIAHLIQIAIPTAWTDDEQTFSQFLRNPGAQRTAEEAWARMSEADRQGWLAIDRGLYEQGGNDVTLAAVLDEGLVWDAARQTFRPPGG